MVKSEASKLYLVQFLRKISVLCRVLEKKIFCTWLATALRVSDNAHNCVLMRMRAKTYLGSDFAENCCGCSDAFVELCNFFAVVLRQMAHRWPEWWLLARQRTTFAFFAFDLVNEPRSA